MCDAQEDDT